MSKPCIVVVPNALDVAINDAIDKALAGRLATDDDRKYIRNELLIYFDEHGRLPEFSLETAP